MHSASCKDGETSNTTARVCTALLMIRNPQELSAWADKGELKCCLFAAEQCWKGETESSGAF